ncbi:MAG: hypothetical protein IKO65_06445 [Victivallales bacterium]|nr:hypothetical protein [Victivallales bacterium]
MSEDNLHQDPAAPNGIPEDYNQTFDMRDKARAAYDQASAQFKKGLNLTTGGIGTADKLTNRFMPKVFKFFKILSAFIICLCLIVLVFALLYGFFKGTPSFEVPVFDTEGMENLEKGKDNKEGVTKKLPRAQVKAYRKKYEDQLDVIIEAANLSNETKEALLEHTLISHMHYDLKKSEHKAYITGLSNYVTAAEKWNKKQDDKKKLDMDEVIEAYHEEYEINKQLHEVNIAEAKAIKVAAYSVAGFMFVCIFGLAMISLLIQIEENTRKG